MLILIALITVLLAAANGANDNIKGAATLFGSGVIGYRGAITLATLATAAGGVASIFLANGLLAAFSGKGIVPPEVAASPVFLLSVGLGAALTVAAATRAGLPVSTTHALLGGLFGAGLAAIGPHLHGAKAFNEMLLPLLLSPVLALILALAVVPLVARLHARAARARGCACLDAAVVAEGTAALMTTPALTLGRVGSDACAPAPGRQIVEVDGRRAIDWLHMSSAAAVSFARGLNDTPKIAALAVSAGVLGASSASLLIVVAMALGGLLAARRVADTLAFRVTTMNHSQGLGANLVTSLLVIGASRIGVPVSTTHVSAGALFGIAASQRTGESTTIRNIVLAWLVTLPAGALVAFTTYAIIQH